MKWAFLKKTIYTHFENKTKLVHETTLYVFEQIAQGIDGICEMSKNPIEEIYEIKKLMASHLKGEKTAPQYQLQKYYPKIFEKLKNLQYDKMGLCVVNNLTKGIHMGIYRENLNIEFVSKIYFSGAISIKNNELFPPEKFSMHDLMEYYLEYHLRGIVTPKGRTILNKIINSNHE